MDVVFLYIVEEVYLHQIYPSLFNPYTTTILQVEINVQRHLPRMIYWEITFKRPLVIAHNFWFKWFSNTRTACWTEMERLWYIKWKRDGLWGGRLNVNGLFCKCIYVCVVLCSFHIYIVYTYKCVRVNVYWRWLNFQFYGCCLT